MGWEATGSSVAVPVPARVHAPNKRVPLGALHPAIWTLLRPRWPCPSAPLSCELRDSGVPAQHFAQPRVEEATERGRAPGRVPATFPRGYLALGRGPKPEPPQVAARRQEDQCSGYGVRPEVSKSAVQAQCGRGEGRGHRSRG
nr:tetraspanin-4 isoform X5 [Manis javanica]